MVKKKPKQKNPCERSPATVYISIYIVREEKVKTELKNCINVFHNKLEPVKWPQDIYLAKEVDTTIYPESQHKDIITKAHSDLQKQNIS